MVLCKKCAHLVAPYTARCPRCELAWPYFRSRRRRPVMRSIHLGLGGSKDCRRCGERTQRLSTPFWLRPLRTLSGSRCSLRECMVCQWTGVAFHPRSRRRAAPVFIPVHDVRIVDRRVKPVDVGATV